MKVGDSARGGRISAAVGSWAEVDRKAGRWVHRRALSNLGDVSEYDRACDVLQVRAERLAGGSEQGYVDLDLDLDLDLDRAGRGWSVASGTAGGRRRRLAAVFSFVVAHCWTWSRSSRLLPAVRGVLAAERVAT